MLLEAGADPNVETGGSSAAHCALPLSPRSPSTPQNTPAYTPPTAGSTHFFPTLFYLNLVRSTHISPITYFIRLIISMLRFIV